MRCSAWRSAGIWLVLSVLALAGAPACAAAADTGALAAQEVLRSSREHYPKILESIARARGSEGKVLAADGAFDWKVTQDSLFWANGFYSGKSVDSRIVKPIEALGADVFAGYRITDGTFPVYQDQLVTKSGGEFNFGIVFSLLRDRDFDDRRFKLRATRLARNEAELDLMLTRLLVQRDAAKSYWSWVAAGRRLRVYEELLQLARQRNAGLAKRVAEGDAAEITLVESRQNILKRQALVTRTERDFVNAAIKLGLFNRDAAGRPQRPSAERLPAGFPPPDPQVTAALEADIAALEARQYRLAILENQLEAERNRIRLAENALLPQLDLQVKADHDLGRGTRSRDEFDIIVELRLSVPLERRKARGELAAARARLAELSQQRRLQEDQLAAEMRRLAKTVEAATEYAALTRREFEQAEQLAAAEDVRFREGASDFFRLNLREERAAEARVRNIEALLDYHQALVDYRAVTVDTEAFLIDEPP